MEPPGTPALRGDMARRLKRRRPRITASRRRRVTAAFPAPRPTAALRHTERGRAPPLLREAAGSTTRGRVHISCQWAAAAPTGARVRARARAVARVVRRGVPTRASAAA